MANYWGDWRVCSDNCGDVCWWMIIRYSEDGEREEIHEETFPFTMKGQRDAEKIASVLNKCCRRDAPLCCYVCGTKPPADRISKGWRIRHLPKDEYGNFRWCELCHDCEIERLRIRERACSPIPGPMSDVCHDVRMDQISATTFDLMRSGTSQFLDELLSRENDMAMTSSAKAE